MKSKFIFIFGLCLLLINFISAVPRIEPYVNDFANLLTEEQETQFNLYLDKIEQNSSWEIALVTVINTEGQSRVEYANKIGDENGVGKLNKDNGIVILYSLNNEHGGAIATGRYSESIFNDANVGRIGREAKQYCDEEKYYECFDYIIKELEKEIIDCKTIRLQNNNEDKVGSNLGWILLIFLVIVIIKTLIIDNSNGSSSSGSSSSGSSSSGNSSSGSSSSGSFGGGSFGGGGCGF